MSVKISELPAAGVLTGAEAVPVVQEGETRKVTTATIAPVQSVAGKVGTVTLDPADCGAAAASHTHDYAATSHTHDSDYADISHTHPATAISNTPAGSLAAVTVQAAIDELESEKAATSHTHTGTYEPALGNPGTNGYVLSSTTGGTRSWVSGGSSPGLVLLATASASNVTSVDFTGIDNTYDEYEVHLVNAKPVNDGAELLLRTSSNNGSSYDSGSTDYFYNGHWNGIQYYTSMGIKSNATSGSPMIYLVGEGCGNATNESGASGVLRFYRPSVNQYFFCHAFMTWFNQGGYLDIGTFSGYRVSASGVDAIRFFFSTGNIASGEFKLYGLKKSL